MTTRMAKVSRTSRTPIITLHCPSCRSPQRCKAVGTATVTGARREVVMCLSASCSLTWVPERRHLAAAA